MAWRTRRWTCKPYTYTHPWIKCFLVLFTIIYAKYREADLAEDLQRNCEYIYIILFISVPELHLLSTRGLKGSSLPTWVPRVPTADMWFHQKFILNSRNFSSDDFLLSWSLFKVDKISSENGIGLILFTEWFYSPHDAAESSVKIIRFVRGDQSISWGQE